MTNLPPVIKIVPMPGPAGAKGDTGAVGPQGPAGTGGGVSSTVPFELNDTSDNLLLSITKTGTGTTRIETPQDDLSLRSARDITLYAGQDGPGNVYIGWGDAVYTPDATNKVATIADIQSFATGDITFDGVKIVGAGTASGDGQSNGTIELVPDTDLYATDQYLIIDPTNPNHIHIRAGGDQDNSTADLILGGERNNVYVEDDARKVSISTRLRKIENTYTNTNPNDSVYFVTSSTADIQNGYTVKVDNVDYVVNNLSVIEEGVISFTASGALFIAGQSYTFTYEPPYNNYWEFTSDGYLFGPAMGGLRLTGIEGIPGNPLWFGTNESIILNATNGQYLNSDAPRNQIVTVETKGIYPRVSVYWSEPIVGTNSHIGTLMYANMDGDNPHFLVPNDASSDIPIGSEIKFATNSTSAWYIDRQDAGTSTLIADGGNGYTGINNNYPYIIPINSTGTLIKVDNNRWILSGPRLTD